MTALRLLFRAVVDFTLAKEQHSSAFMFSIAASMTHLDYFRCFRMCRHVTVELHCFRDIPQESRLQIGFIQVLLSCTMARVILREAINVEM